MKTIFSLHKICNYQGHVIRAEKRSLFFTMEYSLIVEDVKQDQVLGSYGIITMHGFLDNESKKKPLKIIIKQKVFRAKFYLSVDGQKHLMEDYYPDEFK